MALQGEYGSAGWFTERAGFLGRLLPRVIEKRPDAIDPQPLRGIRKHGGGYPGKVKGAIAKGSAEGYDGIVFVADRDGDPSRPVELRDGRDQARRRGLVTPCAVGCPRETLEGRVGV